MTFKITSVQLKQLNDLVKNKTSLTNAEAAQGYSWLFEWTSNTAGTDRASGMDVAVWTWIKGAKDVNNRVGKFSTFIREYTAAQYQLRTGKTLAADQIQQASNAIALSVLKDINDNNGIIPTLRSLGEKDAANTVAQILANTPALWSGNVLFTFLGDGSFFDANILTKKGNIRDSYDFFAAIVSFKKAFEAAFGTIKPFNLINAGSTLVQSISPLLLLQGIGVQFLTVLSASYFIQKLYGNWYVFLNYFIYPSLFNDIVLGTKENDKISTFDGKVDYVQAGEGNDTIIGSTTISLLKSDLIDGGFGEDAVSFATTTNKLNVIVGKNPELTQYTARVSQEWIFPYFNTSDLYNIEKIIGSSQDDLFDIRSISLSLTLDGGAGNDTLDFANAENGVTIDSNTYNATLLGKKLIYSNFETFFASKFNDTLTLDQTAKTVNGRAGRDVLSFANATTGVIVNDFTKTDNILAMNIEEYIGSPHNDLIQGWIFNEVFRGGNGNDSLTGGFGNDTLTGGAGNDLLTGGLGGDRFSFDSSTEKFDTISDFSVVDDTIAIKASGFGGGLVAGSTITASQFVTGSASTSASSRFIYNKTTGALLFDVDGTGATPAVQIAGLAANLALTNQDFLLV